MGRGRVTSMDEPSISYFPKALVKNFHRLRVDFLCSVNAMSSNLHEAFGP